MWAEVNGARQTIGSKIGVLPDSMAYVGGGFDPTLEALVQKAGYTTARSILRSIVQSGDSMYVTNTALDFRHHFAGERPVTKFTISRVPLGKDR